MNGSLPTSVSRFTTDACYRRTLAAASSSRCTRPPVHSAMVANRDEAERALAIARGKLEAGQYDSAIRFAKKSIALEASPEAAALLAKAEQLQRGGGTSDGTGPATASTSATSAGQTSGSTSQRAGKSRAEASGATTGDGGGGEYTPAQLAMVKRVKACRVTAYYEILELEKTCSDGQIKKAYRKVRPFGYPSGSSVSNLLLCFHNSLLSVRSPHRTRGTHF